MVDRALLNANSFKRALAIVTGLLWLSFVAGNLFLIAAPVGFLPQWVIYIVLSYMLLCGLGLLIRYHRQVGQWRVVLLCWSAYTILRVVAVVMSRNGWEFGLGTAVLIFFYAMCAGWVATLILALHRDVSLPFFVISFLVGSFLLRVEVAAAGGVLAWFEAATTAGPETFTLVEPAMMCMSCMMALALPTFVYHLVCSLANEWRRAPL